jgi:hypothetical protein
MKGGGMVSREVGRFMASDKVEMRGRWRLEYGMDCGTGTNALVPTGTSAFSDPAAFVTVTIIDQNKPKGDG